MNKKQYYQWRKDSLPRYILRSEKTNFYNPEKVSRRPDFNISKSEFNNRGKRYISPDTKQKFSVGDCISFIPGRESKQNDKQKRIVCRGRIERFIESKKNQIFIILSDFQTTPEIKCKDYCAFNFSRLKNPANVSRFISPKIPTSFIFNFEKIEKITPKTISQLSSEEKQEISEYNQAISILDDMKKKKQISTDFYNEKRAQIMTISGVRKCFSKIWEKENKENAGKKQKSIKRAMKSDKKKSLVELNKEYYKKHPEKLQKIIEFLETNLYPNQDKK